MSTAMPPVLSAIVRGELIETDLVEVSGRGNSLTFLTPAARTLQARLPLADPRALGALHALSFADICDFLAELGARLDVRRNAHLQQARELSYHTSPLTPPLIDAAYARLPALFTRDALVEMAENAIGIPYLEGWVPTRMRTGATVRVRCYGARCVHIVPGNGFSVSALSIIRNALLRSDAIIKAPSNDPFTAWAMARTMRDIDARHPLVRHLSVAYWKGGDASIEDHLYQPCHVEKIIAWGGLASVRHVTRYIRPGLELIALDPKNSASIIGRDAFASDAAAREAAQRLAADAGGMNQNGCVNARVAWVVSGTDADGIARANAFGQQVYDALLALPAAFSTRPRRYNPDLRDQVDAIRLEGDWYRVIGGRDGEGAVIVSQLPEPVNFADMLIDRTLNIVPVDAVSDALAAVDASTQTVGIYPERLKDELLDVLPLLGAQRIVSLGYACSFSTMNASAHDGLEPMRRMGKWILDDIATPETVPPPWLADAAG